MKNKLMKDTNLNSLQADVVLNNSRELIVPAGAGSGKTKTLVTKVVHLLKMGKELENFLVLTFTKKAANEMKIRIKKELREAGMLDIVNKIDSSDISTFDSFAYNFVKQNASSIGLDSNLELLDQAIFNTYKEKMMKDIFLNIMSDKNNKYYNFLVNFTDKFSTESLLLDFINYYEKLINIKPLNKFSTNELISEILNINLDDLLKELNNVSEEFVEANEVMIEYLFNEYKVIEGIIEENTLSKPKFSWKMLSDFEKKKIESILKPLIEIEGKGLTNQDLKEIKEDIINSLNTIFEILYIYEEKLNNFKTKYNKYEFRDIANYLNIILKENPKVLKRTKDKYKLVFVDEYQDTSLVQSEFLEMLIKDNEDINVLYVGDIKQSIYKFRDAKPDTFINKLNTIDKIGLTTNYRSSPNIIDFVNNIFVNMLTDKVKHDIDYKDNHHMLSGSTKYSKDDLDADVFLLEIHTEDSKQDLLEEAFVIGKKILELKSLDSNFKFKNNAILSRNTKTFKLYRDVFKYLNIPLQVQVDFSLKETYMLKLISNILDLSLNLDLKDDLNNKRFNYISLTRSELYEFDDYKIFKSLIKEDKKILDIDSEIYFKLNNLKRVINTKSNLEIIDYVINEFNVYENIIKAPKRKEKELQIEYLYKVSKTLSDLDIVGSKFVNFIRDISYNEELNIKIPVLQDSSEDSVIITNIHQSKGLEYNTLFLTELNKKFTEEKIKKFKYLSEQKTLVRINYDNNKKHLLKVINDFKIKKESMDTLKEELRLLYVAITRAEKALYIVSTPKDYSNLESFNDYLYNSGLLKFVKERNITSYKSFVKDKDYFLYLSDDNLYYDEEIDNKELFLHNYNELQISNEKASHSINELIDDKLRNNLLKGTITHEKIEYDNDFKENIIKLLNIDEYNIISEYPFIYIKDDIKISGIIDMLIITNDSVYIVDYKLRNINDENYIKQLNYYEEYIKMIYKDKKIYKYLYSISLNKLSGL